MNQIILFRFLMNIRAKNIRDIAIGGGGGGGGS